ncbi:MAG TPA: hemerythrin domain-containing protein [Dehalococcoidia bacterium]|nr:hemerythrin domain-containing protein [Dehalococcoidia bacterium]
MLPGLEELETKTREAVANEDPTAILLADHEWLRGLLEELRPLARRADRAEEVREAVLELQPRLELHIRREEEAYFPAIEPLMEEAGQGSTFDMYGEHDAVRIRLEQLLKALDSRAGVPDAYAALARSMLVHFENEEELIFAEAPSRLDEEARREVIRRFEALATEA